MSAKVQQVLLTYWRRAMSGTTPLVLLLLALFVVGQTSMMGGKYPAGFIWISLFGTALIAVHLKQQMVQVRERRMPDAAAAHIAVGLILILLVGVAIPMNRMVVDWHWCWGYPGLCVALAGLTLAGFATQAQVLMPLFFIAPWAGQFAPVREWVESLWRGELESSGVLLMGIGVGSIAFSIYWMLTATEEDHGYHLRFPNKQTDLYRRDAVDTEHNEALKDFWRRRGWFAPRDPSPQTVGKWRRLARGSFWQKLRLWEYGRMSGSGLRFAILFPLLFVLPQLFITRRVQLSGIMTNPFFLFPVYFLLQMRLQQRAMWSMEMLRPVNRKTFLLMAGAGMAVWTFVIWAATVGVMIGAVAVFSPGFLDAELAVRFCFLTAIGQLWVFASGVWMARFRSGIALFVGFMVPMILVSVLMTANSISRSAAFDTSMLAAYLAISCALCGLVLFDAYRRWRSVELG